MKINNYTWGVRRIRDELLKLSINVSHETVRRVLAHYRKTGDIKPSGAWKRFLSSQWQSIFASDFLTVDSFAFTRFYVFFIFELKTRKIVQFGITRNPNRLFLRNQIFGFEYVHPNSYLIHDNSGEFKYFPYHDYLIKSVPTVPYSPNMNAFAERFIRSIRQECLDHFVIFSEKQLRNIVREYIDYYNNFRPHQGLKGIPNDPPPPNNPCGKIRQKSVLFGLHHHYYRDSA
jgi:transposase InsO family protein